MGTGSKGSWVLSYVEIHSYVKRIKYEVVPTAVSNKYLNYEF